MAQEPQAKGVPWTLNYAFQGPGTITQTAWHDSKTVL